MKNKFRLWLNIVTICLCVCAIAIGVYAATSATLTVSGQIGFTSHGCDLNITSTAYGFATSQNGSIAYTSESPKTITTDGNAVSASNTTLQIRGNTNSTYNLNVGEMWFNDLGSSGPETIVITINITNLSKYYVIAKLDILEVHDNIHVTPNAEINVMKDVDSADNKSVVFNIELDLKDPDVSITEDADKLFSFKFDFSKYVAPTAVFIESASYNGSGYDGLEDNWLVNEINTTNKTCTLIGVPSTSQINSHKDFISEANGDYSLIMPKYVKYNNEIYFVNTIYSMSFNGPAVQCNNIDEYAYIHFPLDVDLDYWANDLSSSNPIDYLIIKRLLLPYNSVKEIRGCNCGGKNLTEVILPKNVTYFGGETFRLSNLEYIIIPKNYVSLRGYYGPLGVMPKIKVIYYNGSMEMWKNSYSSESYWGSTSYIPTTLQKIVCYDGTL